MNWWCRHCSHLYCSLSLPLFFSFHSISLSLSRAVFNDNDNDSGITAIGSRQCITKEWIFALQSLYLPICAREAFFLCLEQIYYFSFKFYFERNGSRTGEKNVKRPENCRENDYLMSVYNLGSASIEPHSRYLFFCFGCNRKSFQLYFVPTARSLSAWSAIFRIWHEFYFRPTSMAKRNSVFFSSFLSGSLCFCNLRSFAIFKKTSTNWLILIAKRFVFFSGAVYVSLRLNEVFCHGGENEMSFALVMRCFATISFFFLFRITFKRSSIETKISFHSGKGEIASALACAIYSFFLLTFSVAMKANFAASFIQYIWRCAWLTHPFANTV